ncbi:MAG: glycosyltransferase family 1 protein [Chthoniobacter sp.]|uniref:glycosyltransferase family 4 protein n=1 Tax=Chthoniobacter sp. TaxID=2510640 RepID=UPI0032A61FF5
MKVLLVSNYSYDRQESMLRFAAVLLAGLRAAGVEVNLVRPEPFFGRLRPSGSGLGKWLGYLDKFLLFPSRLRRLAAETDLVHICDHSNSMYVKHVVDRPHLVTCNDMLAIRSAHGEFPQNRTGWSGRILQRWILAGLRRARRLTCISEATRRDVLRLTGHRPEIVSVTYMGQNFPYAPAAEVAEAAAQRRRGEPFDPAVFTRLGIPAEPYLLHVGGGQWYKNRPGVLAIHAALCERLGRRAPRLLLVGPPCAAPGVEARSEVDNETLAALYSGAEMLLFPSLEEGFGWPIIEAQACGCRVLTTGKDPMTEVGGAAAFYLADPHDAVAGAVAVEQVLTQDEAVRGEAVRAGIENAARFSTERMIGEYLAIYREVLGA